MKKFRHGFTIVELMIVILIMAILAAVVIPILRKRMDTLPPINLNVNEDDKWELLETGEVTNVEKQGSFYYIEFKYAGKIEFQRIIPNNLLLINKGEIGSLYKYNRFNAKSTNSWHQWIKDERKTKINTANIVEKSNIIGRTTTLLKVKNETKVDETILKIIPKINEWQRAEIYKPQPSKPVLVRLGNEIIVVAYFTIKEEWKLNFYRNKMNGGIPLRNVVDWKELD